MKKFFLGALAIAGLVACVQTEEVGVLNPTDGQIAFGGYVGNQSRAAVDNSTDISELNHFTVWGYMDMSVGQIFNNELVTKDSAGAWTYEGTQYWAAGHDYRFFAITPYGDPNVPSHVTITPSTDPYNDGLGTITFTNEEGKEDVLYASKTESTVTAIPEKVTFQFNHLLSKVKFTFTNGYDGEFATIAVKNVTMEVPYKGTVTLDESVKTQYTWENLEGTKTLQFGHVENGAQLDLGAVKEADNELLTIPADDKQTYKVTFDVIVYQGEGTQVSTTHHFESIIADKALVAGTAYNFTATIDADALNAKAIVFDAAIDAWEQDGDTELGYYKDVNNDTYVVTSGNGLKRIAEEINAGVETDRNITLSEDIDLSTITRAASNWTPIGTSANPFIGTFDGKGFKVSNLVIDGGSSSNIGFFGVTQNGEIKNLVIENAKVSGRLNVGVVAGTPYTSKYSNITVTGHVEVNGMAYVGAVGGKNAYANWSNITVNVDETSYVNANSIENGTAYRTYVGGVVGFCGEGGHTFSNIRSNIDVKGSTCDVGGIVGIAHYGNNFVNCVCEGDVEIYNASEEADAQEIGGIAGVWNNTTGYKVTFTNCSFTGELKANNGYVINTNKFGKLVCSEYSETGAGVLVIDGKEYSLADGEVLINGCTPVSTADELVAALEANEGVYLLNDIKIDPAAMSNAYGKTGINVKNGQTIDGAGHTLNIKGAGGTWDSGINTTGGLIKNITVTGSFRGIFINHNSTHSEKVVLENVTITGTVYTISCDQGLYQGIEATNCTFNGWTSFAETAGEAKFVNCNFGEGNGYKYCRPYSKTEFVGCTFCPGYTVDKSQADVTFTDCTFE